MAGVEWTPGAELKKLGFRTCGFREWALDRALKTIADLGYGSVELCLEHPDLDPDKLNSRAVNKVKKWLTELELRVSSVSYHGKQDDLATVYRKQKLAIDVALQFATPVLVVGTAPVALDPQGCASFKELENLLIAADGKNLTVALEPEPDTVMNGMYEFSIFASHMAGAPLGLNLDVGHAALTEGDPAEVISEWAPFISHVHFEDVRRPQHVHLLPGDGHLDLLRVVRKLRGYNYTGDLTVDLFDILDNPQDWARQAMDRCRQLLGS